MDQEDRIDVYTIPPNFAEEGTLFSGRVKTRNAVETAILLMVLVPLLFSLNTTVKIKMYIGMIVLVPVVTVSVIGIQGESLFAFIASFFQYVRRRRCLTEPDERYRLEQNRRKEKARKGGKRGREKRKKNRVEEYQCRSQCRKGDKVQGKLRTGNGSEI
ncbi:hypothetical protein [Enterocloster sp.]|uniref:hypothetical protein n=1 Tax=Enterocloster sp. TaxID=2719315 RepID=UPI003996B664